MSSEEPLSVAVDRELTPAERSLALWMLSHGKEEAKKYLGHLDSARVIRECSCGCGSIDFSVNGLPRQVGPLGILGDFQFDEGVNECNVFIFEKNDILAGIEFVWMFDEAKIRLPNPSELISNQ